MQSLSAWAQGKYKGDFEEAKIYYATCYIIYLLPRMLATGFFLIFGINLILDLTGNIFLLVVSEIFLSIIFSCFLSIIFGKKRAQKIVIVKNYRDTTLLSKKKEYVFNTELTYSYLDIIKGGF